MNQYFDRVEFERWAKEHNYAINKSSERSSIRLSGTLNSKSFVVRLTAIEEVGGTKFYGTGQHWNLVKIGSDDVDHPAFIDLV